MTADFYPENIRAAGIEDLAAKTILL